MATITSQGQDGTTHHLRHEWDSEDSVSERIVAAVAEYENEDPVSLPPIHSSINPAALDALFVDGPENEVRAGCVTFSYYGYTVVVQSTGRILLRHD